MDWSSSLNNNNKNKVTYKQHSCKKNSDTLQAYVIQCCRTGVPSGVMQKIAVDSDERCRSVGRLFQMPGPETAKFLQELMVLAVRCTLRHLSMVFGIYNFHDKIS